MTAKEIDSLARRLSERLCEKVTLQTEMGVAVLWPGECQISQILAAALYGETFVPPPVDKVQIRHTTQGTQR